MRTETIDALSYSATEVLRDGTTMVIRAIRPDDKQRLLQHCRGLSAQSVYYRFFGIKRSLTECDLSRLTELDFSNHVGLAAAVETEQDERFIGVGRYIRSENQSRAEVAFAVLMNTKATGSALYSLSIWRGSRKVMESAISRRMFLRAIIRCSRSSRTVASRSISLMNPE
jgi:hypothetical protein